MTERRATVLAVLGFLLLPPLLMPGAAVGRRVFSVGDNRSTHLPHKLLMARELAEGELPVWSRYWGSGYPILAESQTGVLYPPHLILFSLLPPLPAFTLVIFLHLSFGAIGAFFLARGLGASAGMAGFAGLAYMLHGPFADKLQMAQLLGPRSYIPWAFLAAERLAAGGRVRRYAPLLGTAIAMQVLSGSAQDGYYTTMFTSAYLVLRAPRRLPALAGAYAVLFLVAAPQFVTTYELTGMTVRSSGLADQLESQDPVLLRELGFQLVPHLHPGALRLPKGFIGLAVMGLALLGLLAVPTRRARALAGVALLALLFSMGGATPVYPWLLRIPGVAYFRFPQRNLVFVGLACIMLAALGLSARRPMARAGRFVAAALGACGVGFSLLLLARYLGGGLPAAERPDAIQGVAFVLAPMAVALFAATMGSRRPTARHAPAAMALLALLELFSVFRTIHPTVAMDSFTTVTAAGRFLAEHEDDEIHRVHVTSEQPFVPVPAVSTGDSPYRDGEADPGIAGRARERLLEPDRVMTTQALTSMRLSRYGALVRAFERGGAGGGGRFRGSPAHFGLANVRYFVMRRGVHHPDLDLVLDGHFKVYENRRFLPRARFVARARALAATTAAEIAAVAALPDPAAEILVHDGAPAMESAAIGTATIVRPLRSRRIAIDVACDGPGYLFYSEVLYPGWSATVDGRAVPLWRADSCFMAIPVDAGSHRVELSFWPRHLTVAFGLSFVGLGVVILGVTRRGVAAPLADVRISE